jgi:hypothetical protein
MGCSPASSGCPTNAEAAEDGFSTGDGSVARARVLGTPPRCTGVVTRREAAVVLVILKMLQNQETADFRLGGQGVWGFSV